jgi:hypothetical protein
MTISIFIITLRKEEAPQILLINTLMSKSKTYTLTILEFTKRNLHSNMMEMFCKIRVFNFIRSKFKHNVLSTQNGVLRTNCLDCLDRTNVFQTKVCLKVFEDLLKNEHGIADI